MSKGSAFTRTVQYFQTASLDEAQACLGVCQSVVDDRDNENEPAKPKRKRRTKAQIAADRADIELQKGATA